MNQLPVVRIKFSEDQPRADNGEWTDGGGGGGSSSDKPSTPSVVAGSHAERVADYKKKLADIGIHSVTVETGVTEERAAMVLGEAHAVLSSLAVDPVVAAAIKTGPMNTSGMSLVIGAGKSVSHPDHEGEAKKALAFYNKNDNSITMAGGLTKTRETSKPSVGTGSFVVGTDMRTVIAHEVGHAVSGKLAIAASKAGASRVGAELFNSRPKDYWRKSISGYAGTNPREFMAEAFAAYTHPGYGQGKSLPSDVVSVFEKAGLKSNIRKDYGCAQCVVVRIKQLGGA